MRALLQDREEELARVRRSIMAAQEHAPEPAPPSPQKAVAENHHRALNVRAAEIVAEAKAASESALTEVRTLGRRMGIDTRS